MVECCAEVVAVERGDFSLVPPRVAGAHCEGVVHELEEVVEMPAVDVVGLTRRLELRERVFADRLEHAEARFPRGRGSGRDQAGIQERLEGRRHVEVVPGDRLDSVERDSSSEGSQHPEDLLRIRIQQVVAPVDRRAQRALALREIRRAAREQGEGLAEALRRSFRPQDTDAGCGQLDRERETVESAADARDRVAVLADELEGREHGAGAFAVEADRGDVAERGRIHGTERGRRERGHAVLVLGCEPQRHTARRQDRLRGSGREQVGDERKGVRQMLEIVEEKQPRPVERLPDLVEQGTLVVLLDLECARDRREHERRIGDGSEIDEDAVRVLCGDRARQAGLARPPCAGQRHESRVRPPQQSGDRRHLELASDQVVVGATGCGRCGRGGGERGILPEDGLLELSQLGGRVDAELLDENAARFLVGGERIRLPARPIERKHQLAA